MAVYRKKFVRSKLPPDKFRIQPRDLQLLEDVAEYRFLDMRQMLALHDGGERNLRRRVSDLYHLGYLERPAAQKTLPAWSSIIYSIGGRGKELLQRKDFVNRKGVGFPYLTHAMMVSEFRATLTLALRNYPTHPKIERWLQGYDLKDELASRGTRPELVPDSFFTLRGEKGAADFFLEADQSTMAQKLMLAKMRIYWKWRDSRRYEKTLGIQYFRVLTITKSNERAENLSRLAKQADYRRTGSNMFLFLSETQYSLTEHDLEHSFNHHLYLKLMIDGKRSLPFSAETLPPLDLRGDEAQKNILVETSRARFAIRRAEIEDKIEKWIAS